MTDEALAEPADRGAVADPGLRTDAYSRRSFLKAAGVVAAVPTMSSIIAACGGSSSPASSSSTSGASGTPKMGGTLNVGATGGGPSDTLDPGPVVLQTDIERAYMLYDPLVTMAPLGGTEYRLADALTVNKTATQWVIHLKSGVHFHNGAPMTADDVLFTFQRLIKKNDPGGFSLGPIDIGASKVLDANTLVLNYHQPYAQLVDNLALPGQVYAIVPRGFDPKHPIGTGPFKFQSFSPGVQSTFVRNSDYWQSGHPYLDSVVLSDIADETTQINGLRTGQFNSVTALSATSVASLRGVSGVDVKVNKSGGWQPFVMSVNKAPFNDVRVRQAFRLMVDRKEMLEQVFEGYGLIGNDVAAITDPAYDTSLPQREQDIDQAKYLLKEAGQAGMTIDLYTSSGIGPGSVTTAEVFVQQAKAAGVTVNIVQQPISTYYGTTYGHVPFSMEYWPADRYLPLAGQAYLPSSPYNTTHRNDPAYNALYVEASKATDPGLRTEIVHEMMKYDYDNGGHIIPYFFPTIDGWASNVGGYPADAVNGEPPGGCFWQDFYVS